MTTAISKSRTGRDRCPLLCYKSPIVQQGLETSLLFVARLLPGFPTTPFPGPLTC